MISGFKGEHGFLSNFYEASIYVDGKRYRTVEHAYQAHKSLNEETKRLIRESATPTIAKRLGRAVMLRPDWEEVRIELMRTFIKKKFDNPFLAPLLVVTNDEELVNDNSWNDTFWGVCRGVGLNWLGRILEDERSCIKSST